MAAASRLRPATMRISCGLKDADESVLKHCCSRAIKSGTRPRGRRTVLNVAGPLGIAVSALLAQKPRFAPPGAKCTSRRVMTMSSTVLCGARRSTATSSALSAAG